MRLLAGGLVLVGVLVVAGSGPGQEPLTSFSVKQLRDILQKQGIRIEEEGGDDKQPIFLFKLNNRPALLFNFSEEKVLMLRYSTRFKMPLEVANRWNTLSTRSRAWVDQKKGAAVVESDLDYAAGTTAKNLENFLQQFSATMERFDAVIQELKGKK